jgi:hypothetical protein
LKSLGHRGYLAKMLSLSTIAPPDLLGDQICIHATPAL